MKGLLKYLSPFAPDQSGASGVFYDTDMMIVICDAGGCTGNICGFDEPRWREKKRPIFSAGLRDMDAILGRDDRLVEKMKLAASNLDCRAAVIIGTPVPAVIGTDMKALCRMASKKIGIPVLSVSCTGTRLYDRGEEDAYLALMKFAGEIAKKPADNKKILGVLGATPLNLTNIHADEEIRAYYKEKGYDEVLCYGMGDGMEALEKAVFAQENVVISPSALEAAKYMEREFHIPYRAAFDIFTEKERTIFSSLIGKRVLVLHQQLIANAICNLIGPTSRTASFFMMHDEFKRDGDVSLQTEEDLQNLVEKENFDVIIGDKLYQRALQNYKGEWICLPHYAVGGRV